jgi:predicted phage terminase large subunit-like protein
MRAATKQDHRQNAKSKFEQTRRKLGLNALSFPEYLAAVTPQWTWNWPHQLMIYRALEKVTKGETKRLMIFMPPRHSKSETVTVRYSTYRLERDPKLNIILGSYNQKLANRFSRKIRKIAKTRMALATDRTAVEEWETPVGGGLRAVGVGAGVTGFGAGLIMIDDPVKSREEAESETYREKLIDWFNDDLYTRLEPGGAIVLTQTRWHDDDLAGKLLKEMAEEGGEQWEVLTLPALAEDDDPMGRENGQALCPGRYDEPALRRIEKKLGSYSFSALYQQRPVPLEGGLFKRSWFNQVVEKAPDGLRWVRGYDLAVSTRTSADYTASFRCAFDKNGNLFIADGYRARIEYPEQKRYVTGRMKQERRTEHGIEKALHGQALVQDLRTVKEVRGVAFKAVKVDTDKYTRALPWANLAEEAKVYLVRGSWIEAFLDEVCRFTGKGDSHDDQVDAVSLAVGMLSKRRGRLLTF